MIGSFLLKCSGANPDILEKCPRHETTIQAGLGGIILGTAALALFSGGYALYTVFGNPWAACLFGLAWAMIIFNLDRYIISTAKKTGAFWSELHSYLPRLVMAVLIGFTISEPLKLELFRSEIQEELGDKLEAKKKLLSMDFDQQTALLNDERKTNDRQRESRREAALHLCKERQAPLNANIARMEAEKAERDDIKQSRYNLYLGECAGRVGTKIQGDGPECRRTRKAYETALKEWREAVADGDAKIAGLRKQIVWLENARQVETATADSQWKIINNRVEEKAASISRRKKEALERLERISSVGFLSRYTALNELVNRQPELLIMNFVLTLLFIFVEVAPVMSKMIRTEGPYDYVLKRMDEEVQLEQEVASRVNKSFMGKEFLEHQRAKKVDDMACDAICSTFKRIRVFSDDILREKNRFDKNMADLFSRLKGIKNQKLRKKEEGSIAAMVDAFYETDNQSHNKFQEMLRRSR